MRRMIKETEISKLDAINTNDLAKLDNISEADIQRLNNITDADVARLNKLTDNDVNKIQSITNADIQSVKAMESPKNATADYVLTADGTGKATYKPAKGGGGGGKTYSLSIVPSVLENQYLNFYTPDTPLPESVFGYNQLAAVYSSTVSDGSLMYSIEILYMQGPNGTEIKGNLSADKSIMIKYDGINAYVYILSDSELATNLGITSGSSVTCTIIEHHIGLTEITGA